MPSLSSPNFFEVLRHNLRPEAPSKWSFSTERPLTVWSDDQKTLFLDSLCKNYPIGSFTVSSSGVLLDGRTRAAVLTEAFTAESSWAFGEDDNVNNRGDGFPLRAFIETMFFLPLIEKITEPERKQAIHNAAGSVLQGVNVPLITFSGSVQDITAVTHRLGL